jgi:putative phosphoesterase
MKILFISDIHANLEALLSLKSQIETADMTICLGDIVGYHCHVNEVIELLREHKVVCIQGNHDRYLIEGLDGQAKTINDSVRFGIEFAKDCITNNNLIWLKSLPLSLAIKEDNISILCCHGSPWDTINGYVYEDSDLFTKMQDFKYDVIALGHTHRQYLKRGNPIVFNPGSVGQARDREGIVCAKILCTITTQFEDIYLNYNCQKEIDFSLSCGANDWIYKHFQTLL